MTAFQIYIILQLDQINELCSTLGIILSMTSVAWLAIYSAHKESVSGIMKSGFKSILIIASILLTTATFIPTTKTAITMLVAPQILKDETVRELPNKVLELIDSKLDSLLAGEENSK